MQYNIKQMVFDFSYLLILGATLGGVLVLGIFVAPLIFHTERLLVAPLDHYSAGVVMGAIFHRFSYWVYLTVIFVGVYEIVQYRAQRRDRVAILSALAVMGAALLFSAVYTPKILQMQAEGVAATQSAAFNSLHIASEIDFKILALALLVLFVRRLMLLRIK